MLITFHKRLDQKVFHNFAVGRTLNNSRLRANKFKTFLRLFNAVKTKLRPIFHYKKTEIETLANIKQGYTFTKIYKPNNNKNILISNGRFRVVRCASKCNGG